MKPLRRAVAGAVLAALALSATACNGGDDDQKTPADNTSADADDDGSSSPEEVMAFAKAKLDETSGVELSLSTDDERASGDFLKHAEGVITNAPAFDGTAGGRFLDFEQDSVGVISVDGTFYVNVPVLGWQTFEPADLCAPDPALLLDPATGVSNVLTAAEGLEEGEATRSETDNTVVVTPYTGTVAGAAIKNILPCSPGEEFDVTFTLTADGFLRAAAMTGQFFKGGDDVTYTIDISDYDVEQDITAP